MLYLQYEQILVQVKYLWDLIMTILNLLNLNNINHCNEFLLRNLHYKNNHQIKLQINYLIN